MKARNLRTKALLVVLLPLLSQLPSASQSYDYKIIAKTGDQISGLTIDSIKNNPTINDNSHVAFVASLQGGMNMLVRWNGTQNELLATALSGTYGSASIDDSERVGTRFSASSGGNSYSAIQRYSGPGSFVTLNEAGTAQAGGTWLYLLHSFMDDVAISSIGTIAYGAVGHTGLTYFMVNNNSLRVDSPPFPVISHDVDRVLVRPLAQANSPILLYMASQFSTPDTIASSGAFSRTGQEPGINETATIAALYGERSVGGSTEKGIYVSVKTSNGWQVQSVIRLSDGFDGFAEDSQVAISSPDCSANLAANIAFFATKKDQLQIPRLGLYTARFEVLNPADGSGISTPPSLVAQSGYSIADANGTRLTDALQGLGTRCALNRSGDLVFSAQTATVAGAVILASSRFDGFYQVAAECPPVDMRVPAYFGYPTSRTPNAIPGCGGKGSIGPDRRSRTKNVGCALCCVAMAVKGLGYDIDPTMLDNLIVRQAPRPLGSGGFGYLPSNDMNWVGIEYLFECVKVGPCVGTGGNNYIPEAVYGPVFEDHFCRKGDQVIVQLTHDDASTDNHFVVLTGKRGSDWQIFDPGMRSANPRDLASLTSHLTGYKDYGGKLHRYYVSGYRIYGRDKQNSFCSKRASVLIQAQSPVEVLVVDPSGSRTGYDSSQQQDLAESPGSSYFRDYPLSDDTDDAGAPSGDTSGVKTVFIPSPVSGIHNVTVVGTAPGTYTLNLAVTGPGGASQVTTYHGSTGVGVVSNYSVVFPVVGTADLAMSQSPSTNVVSVGSNVTYTIGIVNLGPSNATAVTVVDTLPQYADFVAAGASQGTVTQAYGVVRCDIGDLPMGGAATVAVTLTPTAARSLTNIVTLMGFEADPNPTNNTATTIVSVLGTNPPPIAVNDSATTTNGIPVTINVLANDISTNGVLDPTTVTITRAPTNGTATVDAYTGTITYTPNAGFAGTNTFQYTVQDDLGSVSSPATVTVVVFGTPQQPNLTSAPYWVRPASSGATDHRYPMLNNLGGFVYNEQVGGQWQVFGTPSADVNPGQLTVTEGSYTGALSPAIADDGSFICTRSYTNTGYAGQMVLTDVLRYPGPAVAVTNPAATPVFQAQDLRYPEGTGHYFNGGPHASMSAGGAGIFSYTHVQIGLSDSWYWSYLVVSDRGTVSLNDQWQGDYPDLNANGHFVFASGSQVYLDNNPALTGQFAHINDAPRDNPEIAYVSGNNLVSSRVGQVKDYNGQSLTGSWVDINRSGILMFEKLVGANYQIFKAYPTEPRIVSTGGTNALVGLPYRYDSDNIAEAYGDPEPDDPRNITPIYWTKVSGPAGFHIDANSGHVDWIPDAPGAYTVVISAAFTYLDDYTEVEDQQTLTIQVAQSTIEVVDAVDFRSGNSPDLFTDPTQYLGGGAPRIGAAADGASRLALRVRLKGAETNSFPNLHFAIAGVNQVADGLLRSVTMTNWAGDVPAPIGNVGGTNWAVGVYQSPTDFDTASQPVTVVLLNGTNIIANQNILLRRPPVVLVHDEWSGPDEFGVLFSSLVDAGLDGTFADYSFTSGGSFETNVAGLYETIADSISGLRQSGFAASRVDMIGHGAGGILARLHVQRHSVQGDNYGLGDVHKLITIGTPHGGSWLASVITGLQATSPSAYANLRNIILSASQASGYVPPIDLSQGVLADESYGSAALADLQSVTVPSHAIASTTSPAPPPDIYSFLQFCLGLTNGSWAGVPPANDGFATVDSQTGGIATNASTLVTNVPHLWQPADTNVAALIVGLLKEPIAGSPRFAFFPASVWATNQPPIPAAQTNSGNWLVLSGLTNGQSVFAGQSLVLTAAATDARPIQAVHFLSPVGTSVDTAAPWDFSLAIPTNAAGAWRVMAAARDTNGQSATALLVLNVTNAAALQSIQVDPPVVSQTSVAPFPLRVWGLYSDGILRDITDGSTGTKYKTSDRFQISVNTNGVLTAKGNTTTTITISITNGVVFTNVQATANLFNLPPTALITVTSTNGVTGPAPLDVQFTALGSGDPEQASLVYSWDYGDGTPGTNQLLAAHRFWKPGANVVTLTVTDPQGLTGTARFVVNVEDHLLINGSDQTLGGFNIYGRVTITNNGSLVAANGLHGGIGTLANGTLTVGGPITMGWLSLTSTSLVTCLPGATAQMYRSDLVVSNDLVVDGSSWIDVSGKGYLPGRTTSNSVMGVPTCWSGGSYGGLGGAGYHTDPEHSTVFCAGQPGSVYGDYGDPNDWGGGSADGGSGGGLIRLRAGQLQLDGQLLADGQSPVQTQTGLAGGAGGGIRLDVDVLSGNGLIRAAGGSGGRLSGQQDHFTGGGGGGGRVAVYARNYSGFDTNHITAPGGGGGNGRNGGAGTVYLRDLDNSQGVLIVNDGGSSGGSTPLGVSGTNWYGLAEPLVIQGANAHVTGEHAGMTLDFLAPVVLVGGASLQVGDLHVRSGLDMRDGSSVGVVGTFYLDTLMSLSTGAMVSVNGSLVAAVPLTVPLGAQVSVEGALVAAAPVSVLGGLLTADQVLAPNCYVQNGGKLTSLASTATAMHWLSLVVSSSLVVDGSSWIDVSGKGYLPGRTTSNSVMGVPTCWSGGSYGGLGGAGYHTDPEHSTVFCAGQPGLVYGDYGDPNDWGGGSADGGSGGGLIRLRAGQLQLDGQLLADGQSPVQTQTGLAGGAGGGIRLDVDVLSGNGLIRAAGGSGGRLSGQQDHFTGGGGGGGRVAVYARNYSGFDTNHITAPGGGGGNGRNGGAGTVYLRDLDEPLGTLVINNLGLSAPGASTPLLGLDTIRLKSWSISGGARVGDYRQRTHCEWRSGLFRQFDQQRRPPGWLPMGERPMGLWGHDGA